ncbi:MAG: hypothetical protein RR620_14390 [Clostridium sp.]
MGIFSKFKHNAGNDLLNVLSTNEEIEIESISDSGKIIKTQRTTYKNDVLIPTLKAHFDNPEFLYSDLMQAYDDKFYQESVSYAAHLYYIDHDKDRSLVLLTRLYIKTNSIEKAYELVNAYIENYGKTGIALTTLAEIYYAQNNDKYKEVLWRALDTDPNQPHAMEWYVYNESNEKGREGYLNAINTLVSINNSWLANLYLAREYLAERNLNKAINIYRSIQSFWNENYALCMICEDLHRTKFSEVLIEFIKPKYDINKHVYKIGIFLLDAYIEVKDMESARELYNELQLINNPKCKNKLSKYKDLFKSDEVSDKICTEIFNNLIFLDSIDDSHLKSKTITRNKKIGMLPFYLSNDINYYGNDNDIRDYALAMPMFFANYMEFYSKFNYSMYYEFSRKTGLQERNRSYNLDDYSEFCYKYDLDIALSGKMESDGDLIEIIVEIYYKRTRNLKTIRKRVYETLNDKYFNTIINEVAAELDLDYGNECEYFKMIKLPFVGDFLINLNGSLKQSLVKRNPECYKVMENEEQIFERYINAIKEDPSNKVNYLLLVSGLVKADSYNKTKKERLIKQAKDLLSEFDNGSFEYSLLRQLDSIKLK